MGIRDRVLPEHVQRAELLEGKLREYMMNRKLLLSQCERSMNSGEFTVAQELKRLSDKQCEEVHAVEEELMDLYMQKQKSDQSFKNKERKEVLKIAKHLEAVSGSSEIVEEIEKSV
ncbi:hypothetical protein OCF62_07385 [Bacillus wiedmannii]|uniref:hypothetical protein n=1 Tax=Bacillus wiedmannii TaxID=1890302 RepID=UPI0021D17AD8|nr:hypothetical protein [Bacillus wiedmannii]MCU5514392.1 hypothetical protein [Bacillus wiedmannii]